MNFIYSNHKNGIEITKDILYHTNKIKRIYWTNEEIDNYFGKRSAQDIIQNGTTCFMNPCFDLTLASAGILFGNKIPHTFVIEEHFPTKDFPFNRLHFVLEFEDKKEKYFLNYKKTNEVYLSGGRYNGREDIPCAQIIRIPGERINPEKTLSENMGYDTLENLIYDKFKGYSIRKNIDRLKQDNSEEKYKLYDANYGKEFKLITKLQNQLSLLPYKEQSLQQI